MRAEIKSFLDVLSANSLIMLIGIIQTFIIPNILEPMEYGYWSLYGLYVSYAGLVILGFVDGIYLKYGGNSYEGLNKNLFSSYFYILLLYLVIIFAIWNISVYFFIPDNKRLIIMVSVGIGGAMACLNSYFILLNQATARFSIYAKGNVIEKNVILIVLLISLFLPRVNAYFIISASILGKLFTAVYFMIYSKDIILRRPRFNKDVFSSIVSNISIGLTLALSGVASMLIIGFGRFVVENRLGVEQLGYYSLIISISALFSQLTYAIATVLFPILRRVNIDKAKYLLGKADKLIINLSGIVLILYYPARYFLEFLFPKYGLAMDSLMFLFPIIICQSRMIIIYNTIYKVLRMEKQLLKNVFIVLLFNITITLFMFKINPHIEMVAFATYISFYFWTIVAIKKYRKNVNIYLINFDAFLSLVYILVNSYFGYSMASFVIVLIMIFIHSLMKFRETKELLVDFKAFI